MVDCRVFCSVLRVGLGHHLLFHRVGAIACRIANGKSCCIGVRCVFMLRPIAKSFCRSCMDPLKVSSLCGDGVFVLVWQRVGLEVLQSH